jgi:tRNA (mo5U34)-methyltransferase
MDEARLREEIIRLGPWHFDIEVAEGLTTRVSLEAPPGAHPESFGPVVFQDLRAEHRLYLKNLYPDGLEGRTVLDCACNSGGFLFWSRELGAGSCFGFDVREHWIRQARFIQEHRPDAGDMQFEVMDLYDLPDRGLDPFDLTIFRGLFYHLPDPVTGLKIAADLTNEVLIIDTNTRAGMPDGTLALEQEGKDALMLGVYGLNWHPTGPETVIRILEWAGFVDFLVISWVREYEPGTGRFNMVASKRPGLLDHWKRKRVDARFSEPE